MMKKLKLIIIFIVIIILLTIGAFFGIKIFQNNDEKVTLRTKNDCVTVNVDEYMNKDKFLKSIKIIEKDQKGKEKEFTLEDCDIDFESYGWITVNNNKLCINKKGIHKLRAEKDGSFVEVIFLSKKLSEKNYVIYEENFDEVQEGLLPNGWSKLKNTMTYSAYVSNGEFILNSLGLNEAKGISLPSYLSYFSNYSITADVTMEEADEGSKWFGVMFRVKDFYKKQYYQMTVRKDLSLNNGIEFASCSKDKWNIIDYDSYNMKLDNDKKHKITIKAYNNCIQEYIDGELIINYNNAQVYNKGGIGIQCKGAKIKLDNIKVIYQGEKLSKKDSDKYVDVQEITDKISTAPTSCIEVKHKEDMEILIEDLLPANILANINNNCKVVDEDGNEIYTLDEFFNAISNKIIPVLSINDMGAAQVVINYLQENKITDVTIMSEYSNIIKYIRDEYPIIRGMLKINDSQKLSQARRKEILMNANECNAKIIYFNEEVLDKDTVTYFQKRLATVWVNTTNDATLEDDIYKLISIGVNGIKTCDFNTLVKCYNNYDEDTLVRTPFIIGHRGIPSIAPENTLDSFRLAYENGADIIESDVYITRDNQIVIMHDDTLTRTTDGTGYVENYTLAELRKLNANMQFIDQYPKEKIPTLKEYLEEFKDKDVVHFIEIKSERPEIIIKLKQMIKEEGMEDQVVLISFDKTQLQRVNKLMPWASVGILSRILASTDIGQSLYYIFTTTQAISSTFNPSFSCMNSETLEALKHRGMTVWPWTYNNYADFKKHFKMGIYGMTTNYSNWAKDFIRYVPITDKEIDINVWEEKKIDAKGINYLGESVNIDYDIIPIQKKNTILIDGNVITGYSKGDIRVMIRAKVKFDKKYDSHDAKEDNFYYIYSEPIIIHVHDNQN